jgi:hypothetical protein
MSNRLLDSDDWIQIFLGFLFFGTGLVLFYLLGQVATLNCTREADQQVGCILTTKWMNISRLEEVKFYPLLAADTEESCDEDGCTYRVALKTRSGSLPMTEGYSSGYDDKKQQVDQINRFLADSSQQTFQLVSGADLWIIFPLVFMGVGVWQVARTMLQAFGISWRTLRKNFRKAKSV